MTRDWFLRRLILSYNTLRPRPPIEAASTESIGHGCTIAAMRQVKVAPTFKGKFSIPGLIVANNTPEAD